jgi:eukaryotic-like serine/threonine-protein kinase
MPTVASPVRPPTSTRYVFGEAIGTGGAGSVYRARDKITGTPVAIKVLHCRITENKTLHQRLATEFRAATQLEHPNIVRALEIGSEGTTSFLVYELVEGENLGDRIERKGKLSEAESVRIITQIAQALHYAHLRNVIHRDVKPDNILVLPDGRAKLTDFGLAKDYNNDQDLTRHAAGLGTPHFMAPEQFSGAKTVDARADIYSLGATLYNAVTGQLPFEARSALAILTKKERGELTSIRKLVPGLSDRVEAATRKSLAVKADHRPATCLEFFKLLTARNSGDIEPASTPRPVGSDRRSSVRHPLDVGTFGRVDTAVYGGTGETDELWPLVVRDLSAGGIGVLLARRFEMGTELTIELKAGPDQTPLQLAARVVRIEPERNGHWVHGCAFRTPLTEDELEALVRHA